MIPAAVATLATQATPDGRRADRFALSWLALRLAPLRRSLGRALPAAGRAHRLGGELWVAPDERSPTAAPRPGSAARRSSSSPRVGRPESRRGFRRRRRLQAPTGRWRGLLRARLVLGAGEVLEVRP